MREFIISEPYERDINTRILNPKLASHAPKVSIIILITGSDILDINISEGMNKTSLSIIPSKHNKDIRRCLRCDRSAIEVA